jgi:hypothetical protein
VSKRNGTCGEERLTAFFNTLLEELLAAGPATPGVMRQVQRARKRARFFNDKLQGLAIRNFLLANDKVKEIETFSPPSRNLDKDVLANARYFITNALERYTSTFDELAIQQPLELSYLYQNWRFGPGSSNGIKGTHAADKIAQGMTCTALCEPFVHKLRRTNPYFIAFDGMKGVSGVVQIKGSKLATVPKNEETERTIAIEPSGNMCLQLAAGKYLEETLRYIGLDISTQQPKNKAMAKRGSVLGDVATLDLKAASDMISIDLVRALMPPEWFDLLMKIRSPFIQVPNGTKEASWVELNMISTMGNGFTFPLMTLIIVSLIYGYRCSIGGPRLFINWKDTCVFGDDIIVPTTEYALAVDTLTRAGLIVNLDKSYSRGPFRESCGGDYLNGVDITPFYVKSLSNELDVYVVINQVVEWSVREKFPLHRTLTLLRSMLNGKPHLVPEWFNPNQGILTSGCPRRYTYLSLMAQKQRLSNESLYFAMPLAVGGYVEEVGGALFYTPRSNKPPTARVRRSRLPHGYLDGWDPGYRSQPESVVAATHVAIHFGF